MFVSNVQFRIHFCFLVIFVCLHRKLGTFRNKRFSWVALADITSKIRVPWPRHLRADNTASKLCSLCHVLRRKIHSWPACDSAQEQTRCFRIRAIKIKLYVRQNKLAKKNSLNKKCFLYDVCKNKFKDSSLNIFLFINWRCTWSRILFLLKGFIESLLWKIN